jgi:gamma-glutamylcyclotransferase (GGCT)/AIG2-like uncharacterized protein YtfP
MTAGPDVVRHCPAMLASLFVYGSLMPGHRRWPVLARHALTWREATTPGALWDTGQGWPAARFDGADAEPVPGWVVEVEPEVMDDLLAELDRLEGVAEGLYRRRLVTLDDGTAAWAYETLLSVDALHRISAWTDQCED